MGVYADNNFIELVNLTAKLIAMAEKDLTDEIRKKLGENLKKLIEEKYDETALRKLDAVTGKDYSWIGKIQNGKRNFRIDSLINLLIALKIQPKDIFNFTVKFPKDE